MKLLSCAAVSLFILLNNSYAEMPKKNNIVKNPGFEDSWSEWKKIGENECWNISEAEHHSGKKSLYWKGTSASEYVFIAQDIPCPLNESSRFVVWVKTKDLKPAQNGGGVSFAIQYYAGGKYIGGSFKNPQLSGTNDWTKLECDIMPVENYFGKIERVEFVLYVPTLCSGEAWIDDIEVYKEEPKHEPLEITVIKPFYRNIIVGNEPLQINFATNVRKKDNETLSLKLKADFSDASGKLVESKTVNDKTLEKMNGILDFKSLPSGKASYKLQVSLINKDTDVIASKTFQFEKVDSLPENFFHLSETGVPLVNGKSFLMWGYTGLSNSDNFPYLEDKLDNEKDRMTNFAMSWNVHKRDDASIKSYLDKLDSLGMKAVLIPTVNEKPSVEFINKWKTHPALLGWFLCDEPENTQVPLQDLVKKYETIKKADPEHPVIIDCCTPEGILKYASACDIMTTDPYPGFFKGAGSRKPITVVTENINAIIKSGKSPCWIIPQAFSWEYFGSHEDRYPNFTELRNMIYQTYIAGAKGVMWYGYAFSRNNNDLLLGIPFLGKESFLIADAVLAEDIKGSVSSDNPAILYSLRKTDKGLFLFAVNTKWEKQNVHFSLSRPPFADSDLNVISEGRKVLIKDGKFRDEFGPFETHLYTTNEKDASTYSVKNILGQIDDATKKLLKKGNIAHQSTGSKVTASSACVRSKKAVNVYLSCVIDGFCGKDTFLWLDKTPGKFPDWLQVTFPKVQKINKVIVYTTDLKDWDVQVLKNGEWTTVAQVSGNSSYARESVFEPVETIAVRLYITAASKPRCEVAEIEVYKVDIDSIDKKQ
ncbi:MAG: hypothetical protein A2017_21775 [Lentisphaerae bacterium GWF2_44_16]|nr:MAG: hypothetical protein A2017_21775 [Lentisphaerae bacterium GWF2_44_16]